MRTTNAAGTAAINLTGNNLTNNVIGNAGANIINGGGGAEFCKGWQATTRISSTTRRTWSSKPPASTM